MSLYVSCPTAFEPLLMLFYFFSFLFRIKINRLGRQNKDRRSAGRRFWGQESFLKNISQPNYHMMAAQSLSSLELSSFSSATFEVLELLVVEV
jgi:hypothetical protein